MSGGISDARISFQQMLSNFSGAQFLQSLFNSNYTLSLGAQGLVSGFHFLLNLILLTHLSQYDYGVFAFSFVLSMFAQAINNALVSTPLTVYTPVIEDEFRRLRQERMLATVNLLFFLGLMLAGAAWLLIGAFDWQLISGVVLFVCSYTARHFSRSFGYARLRPLVTALGDISFVVFGALCVSFVFIQFENPPVSLFLFALASANLCAIVVERSRLYGWTFPEFHFSLLSSYKTIWVQSKWALIGALTTLFLGQAHSVIVTSTYGPDSFAPLAAGFVLFGPVRVALVTWQNMVKPELSIALSAGKRQSVMEKIVRTSLLMVIAVIFIGGMLWLFWQQIYSFLYADKYGGEPMAFIVLIWFTVTLFAAAYNASSAALQAMRDFRTLAFASIYGSVVSLMTVAIFLWFFTPSVTLIGILLAEIFMAVYLALVMRRKLCEQV